MNLELNTHGGVGPVVCPMLPISCIKQRVGALLDLAKAPAGGQVPNEYRNLADASTSAGYDTAFGFIAKRNPEMLGFLEDPVTALVEEYDALLKLCSQRGMHCTETTAPSALRERGFNRTFAFPVEILEAHFL
jgi:hypothetical protein